MRPRFRFALRSRFARGGRATPPHNLGAAEQTPLGRTREQAVAADRPIVFPRARVVVELDPEEHFGVRDAGNTLQGPR